MVKLGLCIFIFLIFEKFLVINGATHWVVTETGRIQAYLESPFNLRRPYDLLALLDQETRNNDINKLYSDLITRKQIIEKKWSSLEGNSNVGAKITSQDPDCLTAGKLFSDIDLYANIATNGTDRKGISIDFSKRSDVYKWYEEPHCSKFSRLNKKYSSLPEMENKTNINITPDESLNQFIPVETVEVFGHEIAVALKKNTSSWLHYNLAAIYWRIKGDGSKAVDCIKRAVQYVPREYQDIPLHNLAGILHQARHSREAALMLHSAIETAPNQAIHYLAIGNVYAALGDYNKSVTYYDKFLEIKPGQKDVVANKHATLCYWKLENGLISFQESLQGILSDLHDFHSQQQQWLRLQERLMWEHASFEYQYEGLHHDTVDSGPTERKIQRCVQKTSDNSKAIISCDSYNHAPDVDHLNLQNLFQYVENEKQKINDQISRAIEEKTNRQDETNEEKKNHIKTPPVLYPKFPTTMPTSSNQYFDSTGWPMKEECLRWNLPVEQPDDLNLPLFLPPENKGYQIKKILSEYIGLEEGSQHELPWYPPLCDYPNVFGDKYVPSTERHVLNTEIKSNDYLRNHLLKYVNDGKADEAEIGQRIITAMEKKSAPRWVLATLASLYWRVRGNSRRALDCLDLAFQIVPKDPTDVVLVSIGSLVYQLGFAEQAMKFATLAFKINYVEPSTNFLLAILHYTNNNPLLAMYYMKNVLRVDPEYYDGQAEILLKTWGCRIKLGSYSPVKENGEVHSKEVCDNKESFKTEGVVCSLSGDQCKNAAIACYKKNDEESRARPVIKQTIEACGGAKRSNLGQTIISSLLAAEGSGDTEPDQSRLERMTDIPRQPNVQHSESAHALHMRLSLGEEHPTHEHAGLGDFYALTEDPNSENLLHVYDKYGTYTLSASGCKNIKIIHKFKYSSVWPSIVARSLDLTSYLKPKFDKNDNRAYNPHCLEVPESPPIVLDHLTNMILKNRLPSSPEKDLAELLGLMASDQKSSIKELGAKIGLALRENATSWILATASAIYWRIVGNTLEAVTCIRLALAYVPPDRLDIPLIHLANLLNRVGFHADALDVAHLALKTHHSFVLNHFTVANIHISMGEFEKAVTFYRACLALDSNFEPARVRLQAVLCTLLFDDANMRKQNDLTD
ncbi:tetratricopeptide repeat protein 17 isoform X3 [Anoplophora glabripennis]|uniref:tetratricopeptide repeat protein 17 isoform X3 n=1 Tax=Anoplophora glabripennis TaxID=217634 RepID=UPI0008740DB0|nr:tetratricopeptide repeat protein 17 isoform X3 [Anoplophora glabripennis]